MFFGKFVELCSLETPVFEIHPSALLPTNGGMVIRFSILPLYKHSLVGSVAKLTPGFNKESMWEQILKTGILLLSLSLYHTGSPTLGHL